MKKMLDETNKSNLENLSGLMKHFYLDNSSETMVQSEIIRNHSGLFQNCLDIEFNSHGRIFIPIEMDGSNDLAYKQYKQALEYKYRNGTFTFDEYISFTNYLTWKSGKINDMKLFKYLRKKEYLSEEQIQTITTARNGNSLFFCISKNPIDMLFCSTNQSFGSCLNLESDYEGAFYMGLPMCFVDGSRYIGFITSGKLKSYSVHGYDFKHFSISSRTWLFATQGGQIAICDTYYPHQVIDFYPIITDMGIDVIYTSDEWLSQFQVPEIYHTDGTRCMPYLDIGYSGNHYKSGKYGCYSDFNYQNGFGNLYDFDDLHNDNRIYCQDCDCSMNIDCSYYIQDHGDICESCFDNYSRCSHCDDMQQTEDGTFDIDDNFWCNYCSDNNLSECSECYGMTNDIQDTERSEVCQNCFDDNYFNCDECCGNYHMDNHNTGHNGFCLCPECFAEENKLDEVI